LRRIRRQRANVWGISTFYVYYHGIALHAVYDIEQYVSPWCIRIEGQTIVTLEVIEIAMNASIWMLIIKYAVAFFCSQHHKTGC